MMIGSGDPSSKTNLVFSLYVVSPMMIILMGAIMWRNAVGYGLDHNVERIIWFIAHAQGFKPPPLGGAFRLPST